MRVARNVAVEILKQTKHYERDSCGGASQIWMVPTDCGVDLSDVSQVDIASLESQLERAGADTARLLALGPGITGVDFNQETAERRRQTLDTAVSAAQTQYETLNGMIALKGELGLLKITPQPPPDEDSEG
jgi:hypothetical protein